MNNKNKTPPPEKPNPNECCGSGCNPCVFDYYYAALEKWQQDCQSEEKADTEDDN